MPATLYTDTAQLNRGGLVPHVLARYRLLMPGWPDSPPAVAVAAQR